MASVSYNLKLFIFVIGCSNYLFLVYTLQMDGSILIPEIIRCSMLIITASVQRIRDAAGRMRKEFVKKREGIWQKLQVKPRTTRLKH